MTLLEAKERRKGSVPCYALHVLFQELIFPQIGRIQRSSMLLCNVVCAFLTHAEQVALYTIHWH